MESVEKVAEEPIEIPDGLRPLLEVFAKETLKSRPTDILYFAKVFFDELYRQKNKDNGRDVIENPHSYEKFRNHLYMKCGYMCRTPPRDAMDLAATKIQAAFRGHIVRARPDKFGTAPMHDQNRRNSSENQGLQAHEELHKRRASSNECSSGNFDEEKAATKIQAEFRGYITRKHLEKMKKDGVAGNGTSVH